ncbi:MAG TPA: MFS transporter [Lacipirellulaceae bacterium]|nr:MFS transporter [Lacipirellulaceae bacterium]
MTSVNQKLALREKFAYGVGDAGANLVFQTQITFLLFFYTNVLGIASGVAGTILLISRAIDACSDPIIGALADRTRTRWGHYRPWILWTAVPMAIALVLCYTAPDMSATAKVVWAIVTYNVLMAVYAANNIPYCALSGVMTSDPRERTSLSSWRFVCAMFATLVVNMFTLKMVDSLGGSDVALGYQWTMAAWGVVAVILFCITFTFTRERVLPSPRQRSTVRQDLSDLLHNKPWFELFGLALLIHVELALRGGGMLYYFKYYSRSADVFSWIDNFGLFNGVGLAFVILGVSLSKWLVEWLGKKAAFRLCLVLSAVFMGLMATVPRDSLATLFLLQILLQLSFGPTIPILWSMMADVVDYSEWETGRRSTALAFASIVFGLKLGLGIGGWLDGEALAWLGYSKDVALTATGERGIVMLISVVPAAALLIGAIVLRYYPLTDRMMDDIEIALAERRAKLGQSI